MFVANARPYDVIVVGAGHAGCEAALAAGRMGARVLVITQNIDRIGWLSCNPAIGGLGLAHLDAAPRYRLLRADKAGADVVSIWWRDAE